MKERKRRAGENKGTGREGEMEKWKEGKREEREKKKIREEKSKERDARNINKRKKHSQISGTISISIVLKK